MKTGKFSVALRTTARPRRDQPGPAQQAVVAPCAALHLILFSVNLCVFAPHRALDVTPPRHYSNVSSVQLSNPALYNNPNPCHGPTAVSSLCIATYLLAQMFLRKWSESDSLHFALYSLVISFNYELVTFHESLSGDSVIECSRAVNDPSAGKVFTITKKAPSTSRGLLRDCEYFAECMLCCM